MPAGFDQLKDMVDCLRERTQRRGYICAVVRSNGPLLGYLSKCVYIHTYVNWAFA